MNKTLHVSGVVLGWAMVTAGALVQNRTATNQYSFGDSLTDHGNVLAASGGTVNATPPCFGGRWSNGPTFAELLGNTLAVGAASNSAGRARCSSPKAGVRHSATRRTSVSTTNWRAASGCPCRADSEHRPTDATLA